MLTVCCKTLLVRKYFWHVFMKCVHTHTSAFIHILHVQWKCHPLNSCLSKVTLCITAHPAGTGQESVWTLYGLTCACTPMCDGFHISFITWYYQAFKIAAGKYLIHVLPKDSSFPIYPLAIVYSKYIICWIKNIFFMIWKRHSHVGKLLLFCLQRNVLTFSRQSGERMTKACRELEKVGLWL